MIVLPFLWKKFLFPALGHYHVDLDLSVLSVSTCCAFMHFSLIQFFHDSSLRYIFRIIIAYQESIIASFEDIWQSKLSQNVDRR